MLKRQGERLVTLKYELEYNNKELQELQQRVSIMQKYTLIVSIFTTWLSTFIWEQKTTHVPIGFKSRHRCPFKQAKANKDRRRRSYQARQQVTF